MRAKTGYWVLTALLSLWLALGGWLDLTRASAACEIMRTLRYPDYVLLILGTCKLLAIPALLYPKAGRLREWAYAGIAFDAIGAVASHVAVRDQLPGTIAPVILLAIALGSYILYPRRLAGERAAP